MPNLNLPSQHDKPIHAFVTNIAPERIVGTMEYQDMSSVSIVSARVNQYDNGKDFIDYLDINFVTKTIFPTRELELIKAEINKFAIPISYV